jgi:hypothetical protein
MRKHLRKHGRVTVAQTLLSVLVRLGTAEKINRLCAWVGSEDASAPAR